MESNWDYEGYWKKVKNYSNDDDLLVTYDKEYLKLLAEIDKKEALKKSEIKGKLQETKDC